MKRTKERTEMEMENEERQAMFASSISDAMKHQGSRFIVEPSYVNIENLTFGRMAFGGMNPEIEKMIQDERSKLEEAEAEKKEKDVQDDEMLDFYSSSVSSTISKKFASKRNFQGSKVMPSTSSSSASESIANPDQVLAKGQKYVQNMRQQNYSWKKGQKSSQDDYKRRKMMKPSVE